MLVLDQADAHVALAVLAEADAGRDRDAGLLDQQLGERSEPSSSNGFGIGAQANIEAGGDGMSQPAAVRPSTSTSRRDL